MPFDTKEYYLKNKEKIKEKNKEYSHQSKKSNKISKWKGYGLITDKNEIYDRWLNSNNCELCGHDYSL